MKTITKIIGLVLGLCLYSLSSCQEKKKDADQEIHLGKDEIRKQIISLADADSFYLNYSRRRATAISEFEIRNRPDEKQFIPTRFVDFDLETIKNYIKYVESEAKNGGTKVDSLRIYLGNYGNSSGEINRHNTVFIVPTAKAQGSSGGIYIGADGKAKLMRKYFNGNNEINSNKQNSLILNFGHCCPPKNGDF